MREPDADWLLLRERGGDVSHVPARERARYEQLAGLFQALPGEAPSPGWKGRILDAIDASPARERAAVRRPERGRPAWLNLVGLAVAASCVVAIVRCGLATDGLRDRANGAASARDRVVSSDVVAVAMPADAARVTTAIRRTTAPVRGEVWGDQTGTARAAGAEQALRREYAHVGDTLILHVQADPALELRVYGDAGEPLARCAELLDCDLELVDGVPWLRLEVALRSPGRVSAMLFTRTAVATPFHDLNRDLESAHKTRTATRRVALVLVN